MLETKAAKRKKITVELLDRLFSKYVRLMSGGYCKRCWRLGRPNAYKGWKNLDCAHFRPRGIHATRWDYNNVAPLCSGCHFYIDNNSTAKDEFFLEILGKELFDAVIEKAKPGSKPDREKIKVELKVKIKILTQGGE